MIPQACTMSSFVFFALLSLQLSSLPLYVFLFLFSFFLCCWLICSYKEEWGSGVKLGRYGMGGRWAREKRRSMAVASTVIKRKWDLVCCNVLCFWQMKSGGVYMCMYGADMGLNELDLKCVCKVTWKRSCGGSVCWSFGLWSFIFWCWPKWMINGSRGVFYSA